MNLPKLCPMPREIRMGEGFLSYDPALVTAAVCPGGGEAYRLEISDTIALSGTAAGVFYGEQTLAQLRRLYGDRLPRLVIEDSPALALRGVYHDVTRGRVPTLATLKALADRLALYKINQLQLYVEDCVQLDATPALVPKSPLTKEEIREFDRYCADRFIDLVPSLSTFGHLYALLECPAYAHLREIDLTDGEDMHWINKMAHHTLDVSNPQSIALVTAMIDEYMSLFSSDIFNICCDETFDLGEGKTKELAQKIGKGRMYVDFLLCIIRHVHSRGKKVQFWGDIILQHPEYLDELPAGVQFLNWDYSAPPEEKKAQLFSEKGVTQILCPGTSGWNRFANRYDVAFPNIRTSVEFAVKYGALGVLCTDWGDFGHVNQPAYSIPPMAYSLALSWNPQSPDADTAISLLEYGTADAVALLQQAGAVNVRYNWDLAVHYYNHASGQCRTRPDWSNSAARVARLTEAELRGNMDVLAALLEKARTLFAKSPDCERLTLAIEGEIFLCRLFLHFVAGADVRRDIDAFLPKFRALWLADSKPGDLDRLCGMIERMGGDFRVNA